jgi:AcrR family transcriptional regulator
VIDAPKKSDRGRPRSGTNPRPDLSASEQILDAAAHLFVERGYAATSTRAIAEEVGIRQASLYYHFPSKEQMLEVLLMRTVEPSIHAATYLSTAAAEPAVRLHALIEFDTAGLLGAAHNVGTLYFLPEVRNERFAAFQAERATLRGVYAVLISQTITDHIRGELGETLTSDAASAIDYLVDVVFGMVESVISIRADRPGEGTPVLVDTIAQSCLRVLGHDSESIRDISSSASTLLIELARVLDDDQPGNDHAGEDQPDS